MNLGQVIDEANLLVPNELTITEKALFINNVNQDFFNVVKIPRLFYFNTIANQSEYQTNDIVRFKNIDIVHVGVVKYKQLLSNTPNPLQNTFTFDDFTTLIRLNPAPYQTGLTGFIQYFSIATISYSTGDLFSVIEAPEEYHWTYVFALASYIAQTQDDAVKASNYENQYKAAWNVAAQNYAKEVTQ